MCFSSLEIQSPFKEMVIWISLFVLGIIQTGFVASGIKWEESERSVMENSLTWSMGPILTRWQTSGLDVLPAAPNFCTVANASWSTLQWCKGQVHQWGDQSLPADTGGYIHLPEQVSPVSGRRGRGGLECGMGGQWWVGLGGSGLEESRISGISTHCSLCPFPGLNLRH